MAPKSALFTEISMTISIKSLNAGRRRPGGWVGLAAVCRHCRTQFEIDLGGDCFEHADWWVHTLTSNCSLIHGI